MCMRSCRHPKHVGSMNSQRGAEGWAESRAGHQEQEAMAGPPARAWRREQGVGLWLLKVAFGWEKGEVSSRRESNSEHLSG